MRVKPSEFNRNTKKGGLLLAAGVITAQRMLGGPVIMTQQPPVVVTPPVVQEDATNNEMNVFIPAGVVNPDSAGLLQYGPVTFHPHVSNTLLYGSGIQYSVGNQQDTVSDEFAPGLTVDLGRHWTVDYTPTFNFYSSRQFRNVVDQSASLAGATHYEDWNFNLSQNFSSTSDPITETGAQTGQKSDITALSSTYVINDKWVANFGLNQDFYFVSGLQNSYNWSTMDGVSYQFWPRLNAGVSIGGGYTRVEANGNTTNSNPDSVNEEMQFNLNWRATDKISFQASVGLEDEQFLAIGYNDSLNPIFSAAIQYQPFKDTQISVSASRAVEASDYFIVAQTSDVTTIGVGLNQRILVKYNLTLGAVYTQSEFTSTKSTLNYSLGNARTDNEYSFNASFGRQFLKHGNWAITYAYTDNQSDVGGYSQRSNQIGLQVGFSY